MKITEEGLLVRAPLKATDEDIDRFIKSHSRWVEKHLEKLAARSVEREKIEILSEGEILLLKEKARELIPKRVRYYAPLVGVSPGRITIRTQKTLWGSCTAKGNLSFNCLLMLAPDEVVDSIVVHELCHMKHMNHSPAFYEEVLRVFPEYWKCDRWLKDNGWRLMARVKL